MPSTSRRMEVEYGVWGAQEALRSEVIREHFLEEVTHIQVET